MSTMTFLLVAIVLQDIYNFDSDVHSDISDIQTERSEYL